jgi:hypothetical protein
VSLVRLASSPKEARAGGRFTVGAQVVSVATGGRLRPATTTCYATIRGRWVPLAGRSARLGYAQCVWRLPRHTAGKMLTGSIAVTYGGSRARRSFSKRVR